MYFSASFEELQNRKMAHWFHRNPLKATAPASFDLRLVATNAASQKICSEARQARQRLLEVISDPNNEVATLETAVNNYLALLHGFMVSLDDDKSGDSKMRMIFKFKWTNTLCGNMPQEQQDTVFELICMGLNIALWYTKHAAKIAGKEEPAMEEAKEVHKCLRKAAGIFQNIQDSQVGRLVEQPEKGTDMDSRVLNAYIHQSTAEAQEVTLARAIELKHSSSLVSALAYETSKMFINSDDSLASLEEKDVGKWRKYLQLKSSFYHAYAYSYHGETLLAEDKCGEAIRCLQESVKYFDKATTLSKDYSSTKGPGTTCKPQEHAFYKNLGTHLKRTLEKCERENGFIYHQKVPPEAPELELKATYGLVKPEEFEIPAPSPLWSKAVYGAFDITKNTQPDDKKKNDDKKKDGEELPPVKEADIPQSNKDPKTFSGCSIS
ncbi:unnamed protein product [Owenia fusiformis]|uniref:BRO1 domain-containing protein n=1 Tax=Owenia fusiformis TaxID=6347 RepID=A0A8S4PCQ3_OWEFU|nr:unnamed protein product [Owenia fusiformis]